MPDGTYYWFAGASFAAIRAAMGDADPDTGRLEVRLEDQEMTITIVPDGVNANAPINDSHRCPPSCP